MVTASVTRNTRETAPGVTRNSGSPHSVMDELSPSRRPPPTARRSPTPISTRHRWPRQTGV